MVNLYYHYMSADLVYDERRHPQVVMGELCIAYKCADPVASSDGWIFYDCENIPESLPAFIECKD